MNARISLLCAALAIAGCAAQPPLRGTGDLGLVIERGRGQIQIVETTGRTSLATVGGFGDLSHAAAV